MNWTYNTTRQVMGLTEYHRVTELELALSSDPDELLARVSDLLRQRWMDHAKELPVIVDRGDLRVTSTPDRNAGMGVHVLRAYWSPATSTAEFFGGPKDGECMDIPQPSKPVTVRTMGPDGLDTIVYTLAGWSEAKRRWLYWVKP